MTKATERAEEQAKACEQLRKMFPIGSTVSVSLNHASRSGMTRAISVLHGDTDGSVEDVSWLVARTGVAKFNGRYGGLTMGGCGMDMGFALVYSLASTLYRGGFPCADPRCPSNDHSNDYGSESRAWREAHPGEHFTSEQYNTTEAERYSPQRMHSDPGYALSHRWI